MIASDLTPHAGPCLWNDNWSLWRHAAVCGLGLLVCALTSTTRASDEMLDFEVLRYRARLLAAQPYQERPASVPESLLRLTYDQHREIRFRTEQAWWRRAQLPFQLQFFHPGFIHHKTVQIHELNGNTPSPIPFDPDLFDYGPGKIKGRIPATMGFSGFRIHYALNSPGYLDELAVFQGASYFRALGREQHYGLSARGLAVNTAEPGGEEFPLFEEFWIRRPDADAKHLTVFALLNSPSVCGAYRFVIVPGASTVMQVKAALYFRENPVSTGLAPLTSMFWHGENSADTHRDFRPEVHDSDGLMINTGTGEWLWRPLVNPQAVRTSSFADHNPRGFGLVQRDRNFASYEDLEAHYHQRPSTWVEPVGDWGRGTVRLVEIPTPDETNDNIVAFWTPESLPAPGEPVEVEYRLHWFADQIRPPAGFTVATRHGRSLTHEPELERFMIDFDGAYLRRQRADPAIEPVVTVGEGATLASATLQKNPFNGTWRVAIAVRPDGTGRPVSLRCFLRKPPHVLTETWSYLWQP